MGEETETKRQETETGVLKQTDRQTETGGLRQTLADKERDRRSGTDRQTAAREVRQVNRA